MKTKALFAGAFAVLLALAILPGAFAQWTGASPEAEEEEVTRRAVLSDMYGVVCYEAFPRCGPVMKGFAMPLMTIGAELFADILGLLQSLLGMDFQSAIDEMTGASPHMMPFFMGMFSACGLDCMGILESLLGMLDFICSLPCVNPLCWWTWGELAMRHTFGPALVKEMMPQSYGIEG